MPSQSTPRRRRLTARAPVAAAALAAALAAGSCDRSVSPTEALPPLQAASLDAAAGGWRMLVLSAPDQIAVPAPAAAASDAYRAEVEAVKVAQGRATDAQRRNVDYWSGGGVL